MTAFSANHSGNTAPGAGIVVPVYNRSAQVCDTLDTIKAQTYRPIHLVAVDNASTDGTRGVLLEWKRRNETPDFRVTVAECPQRGAAAARNCGLELVDNEFVMFFDSDDTMRPDLVARAMATLRDNPGADAVYWRHVRTTLGGGRRLSRFAAHGDLMEWHLIHALINTPSYMTRRSVFARIPGENDGPAASPGWNTELRLWDDYELGMRLLLQWNNPVGIDEVLYEVRSQEESITGTEFSSREGEWERVLDLMETAISASGRKETTRWLRMLDYRRAILAAHYRREGNRPGAERLLAATLASPRLNARRRALLRFAYRYTAAGGRGAWSMIRRIY